MAAYQEESPREIITTEIKHRKASFKDVEAQKIREDVTIQVGYCLYHKNLDLISRMRTFCNVDIKKADNKFSY